mmetsp:Transcript_6738/g.18545  ORF Transcript_6738/g.18545 Transcript_6738/m.18545 type:complete len:219 (-) Transcript_6738:124-780(-)|eukprot:CAMPEP_0179075150 /NCGR_PEP_ID=MMETSP0796-20121207/33447_1 /TAXON_ID=73915 /ORGANISM="Pyrodinium bahamense, Strain pbaha01" /LENGTH=218 /DNA_ID=CAMNT_0020772383 /DNA_START=105 /DNA_END=761 /DNA_ORIENTATION=-
MALDPDKTVEEALRSFAKTFKENGKEDDLAHMTEHALKQLGSEDSRDAGIEALTGLRDKLHVARRLGSYVHEANMVERIAGNFQHVDGYSLQSMCPVLHEDQPEKYKEMMKAIQEADKAARCYEFLNSVEAEEMTVNIPVPPGTKREDVKVSLTATTLRVEVRGHERQPFVIDGPLFKPIDTDACDHHLEGSGDKRMLVLDLEKQQGGLTWPDLFKFG